MSGIRHATRYLDTIELKPSSELIPDEYEIIPKRFFVEIFYGVSYKNDAATFASVLKDTCEFNVSQYLFDNYDNLMNQLSDVQKRLSNIKRSLSGAFIIVLCDGDKEKPGHLKMDKGTEDIPFMTIWDPFLKLDCLNRKPKLFLFQSHYPTPEIETDVMCLPKRLYDLAAPGADMMLISRTIDKGDTDDSFIKTFCHHIENSGEFADIFEIATFSTTKCRPIIVSTLTARFFTRKANHRDYNHVILKDIQTLYDKCVEIPSADIENETTLDDAAIE